MVKPTIKSNSESQDLLKVLSHFKPKIRNAILKNCENDLIHIFCDCVYNVVKGNVPGLTQEKVNKLARHRYDSCFLLFSLISLILLTLASDFAISTNSANFWQFQ